MTVDTVEQNNWLCHKHIYKQKTHYETIATIGWQCKFVGKSLAKVNWLVHVQHMWVWNILLNVSYLQRLMHACLNTSAVDICRRPWDSLQETSCGLLSNQGFLEPLPDDRYKTRPFTIVNCSPQFTCHPTTVPSVFSYLFFAAFTFLIAFRKRLFTEL